METKEEKTPKLMTKKTQMSASPGCKCLQLVCADASYVQGTAQ